MQHFDNFKISFENKITETIHFLSIISLSTNLNIFGRKVSNWKTPAHLHFEGNLNKYGTHTDMERVLHFHVDSCYHLCQYRRTTNKVTCWYP